MELYESEGLEIETIAYNDNQPLIDLVCRRDGLMGILDEEATLGRGTDENWLAKFTKKHKDKPKILRYRAPKTTFVLQHFAGELWTTFTLPPSPPSPLSPPSPPSLPSLHQVW